MDSKLFGSDLLRAKEGHQTFELVAHNEPSHGFTHRLLYENTHLQGYDFTLNTSLMELKDRIKQARSHARLTQTQLAERVGMDQTSISNLERGKSAGSNYIAQLARVCGVSPIWLAEGIGEMLHQFEKTEYAPPRLVDMDKLVENIQGTRIEVKTRSVPVVGKAMLGPDGYFDALDYPVGHGEGMLNVVSRDDHAYGLRVVGHSMEPRIKHNEFVLIEPNHGYVAGDEVLLKTTKGQAMIKLFAYLRDGEYRFDSINAEYAPVIISEADVESIQFVGAIVKGSMFMAAE